MGRQNLKYKLWLFMINISNNFCNKLLLEYRNEENIYLNFENILKENRNMAKKFIGFQKNKLLDKAIEKISWMNKNNIGFIAITDKEYPDSLRNIREAPYGLFYKGNINLLKGDIIAIIGSRNSTNYGEQVTKMLTKELIRFNITIISGGAKGIDTIAHKVALEEKGNTIAVLGCGIDVCYPACNNNLFKKIEERGLIISEFPIGEKPFSYNFPRRNRIISALSRGIIVTEATEKSGSLITVNYALEQGKNIMTVPGSVFSKNSSGCNKLIFDGAYPYTSMEDLKSLFNLREEKKVEKEKSALEKVLLEIISKEPIHIDEILTKSYVDREALYKVLFEMQIKNEIVSLPGNFYAKVI